ncbi:tautomerase enzyme [Paenibacillus oralis]|uniref:Tautomerase enzyme n=1 Tax=Paenibacillus oralis TaxID=2490856 RepID=A0A3P3U3Y7_9BACL|nr:tautomerase enzyme [Paenibacillus oralis]RRJ64945.1 tautomerase enzyme [Paenibacillus oralis]
MTMIAVHYPEGRITLEQRRLLAESLTDAVLIPEVGQFCPPARDGFQVRFAEYSAEHMAIGGKLLADGPERDIITVNILVMDGDWPNEVRKEVLENILDCLGKVLEVPEPPPTWWVSFQVIEEGSWGSRGGVLSILDLLDSGVFTEEKIKAIRQKLG